MKTSVQFPISFSSNSRYERRRQGVRTTFDKDKAFEQEGVRTKAFEQGVRTTFEQGQGVRTRRFLISFVYLCRLIDFYDFVRPLIVQLGSSFWYTLLLSSWFRLSEEIISQKWLHFSPCHLVHEHCVVVVEGPAPKLELCNLWIVRFCSISNPVVLIIFVT